METAGQIKVPRRIINALGSEDYFAIRASFRALGIEPDDVLIMVANQVLSHGDLVLIPDSHGGFQAWRCLTELSIACNQATVMVVADEKGKSLMLNGRQTRGAFKVTHRRDAASNWLAIVPQLAAPAYDGDLAEIVEFNRLYGTGEIAATGETVSLTRKQFDELEPARAVALAKLGLVEIEFMGIAN